MIGNSGDEQYAMDDTGILVEKEQSPESDSRRPSLALQTDITAGITLSKLQLGPESSAISPLETHPIREQQSIHLESTDISPNVSLEIGRRGGLELPESLEMTGIFEKEADIIGGKDSFLFDQSYSLFRFQFQGISSRTSAIRNDFSHLQTIGVHENLEARHTTTGQEKQ